MPRLSMIEPQSFVCKQTIEVGDRNDRRPSSSSSSSSSQPARSTSESKKLVTAQHKTDAVTATAAESPENASTSTAKSQRMCNDGATTSRPPSASGRKLKWNALVRKSKPPTLSSDDDVSAVSTAAKNGTESRESEIVEMNASGVEHSDTTDSCVNDGRHSASSQTLTMSSCTRRRVEARASEHDCCSRKECRDCRSVVSPLSSLSSLSTTTSSSSLSSSPRRKRRRLNAGRAATTKCSRCKDDDSYPSDRHRDRCRCCRPRHGRRRRRRRCCCSCRRERHYRCDDGRRAFEDDEQYGTAASSHRQSAHQSAADYPPTCVTPTDMFSHTRSTPSYTHRTPHHQHARGIYGLNQPFDAMPDIKQEPSEDSCEAQRPLAVDGRTFHLPPTSTSQSFAHHVGSSSMLSDRSVLTSVESCTIPLEPVTGLSPSVDPRQLRQRHPVTSSITAVRTNVDELDVTQATVVSK